MKLESAIHHAGLRKTEVNIVARVLIRPTPSGFMHRVEYDLTHLPSHHTVGVVSADGKFSIL